MDTSGGSPCSICPEVALDPLGHLAVSCKRGEDAVIQHNQLRELFAEACRQAHFPVRIEMSVVPAARWRQKQYILRSIAARDRQTGQRPP